jgi:hypothetical protein
MTENNESPLPSFVKTVTHEEPQFSRTTGANKNYQQMIDYAVKSKEKSNAFQIETEGENKRSARTLWTALFPKVLEYNKKADRKFDLQLSINNKKNIVYLKQVPKGTSPNKRQGKRKQTKEKPAN